MSYNQSHGFSSSHVQMWELDHKESSVPKNWYFWTVVLEKTLESPLDYEDIKPVNLKGNQFWIFIGRTDAEAPILWPPDRKSWLTGKDPDAGKDWRQKETRLTEDEMVGWHHWLNGHEFEQALGDGESQGSLACCSPWGCKESDMTEWLNNSTITGVLLSSDKKGWKKKPGIFLKKWWEPKPWRDRVPSLYKSLLASQMRTRERRALYQASRKLFRTMCSCHSVVWKS